METSAKTGFHVDDVFMMSAAQIFQKIQNKTIDLKDEVF